MKSLVVYSSRTGNTAKVARAIFEILPEPKELHSVEESPSPEDFDLVAIGFWVDKGKPDEKSIQFMKKVQGTTVALFGTLGASPESDHARDCMRKAIELVSSNRVVGTFMCQGRVKTKTIDMVKERFPESPSVISEVEEVQKMSNSHPDERDLKNAQRVFLNILQDLQGKEEV